MPSTAFRRCRPPRTIMPMPSPLSRSCASTQHHASGQTLAASEQNDDLVHHETLRAALRLRKKEDDCADEQHQPAPALQKKKTRPVPPVEARQVLELIRSDRLRATGEDKRPRRLSRTAMRSLLTRPGGWPGSAAFAGEVTAHRSRGHQRVQLENGERRLASSSWRVGRGAGRPPPPSARLGARHGVSQSAASAWRAGKAQEQCTGK